MRTRLLCLLLAFFSIALWAADKIQPLNVKLGLWEVTSTTNVSGMPPIPDDVLARMTPEQRARMEAAMKARSGEGPKTTVRKECITKEKLEKDLAFGDEKNSECTHTVVSSSSSGLEVKLHCANQGVSSDGTFRVDVPNSEAVKGSVQMVSTTNSQRKMNINSTFSGKYLGASCGDVN